MSLNACSNDARLPICKPDSANKLLSMIDPSTYFAIFAHIRSPTSIRHLARAQIALATPPIPRLIL